MSQYCQPRVVSCTEQQVTGIIYSTCFRRGRSDVYVFSSCGSAGQLGQIVVWSEMLIPPGWVLFQRFWKGNISSSHRIATFTHDHRVRERFALYDQELGNCPCGLILIKTKARWHTHTYTYRERVTSPSLLQHLCPSPRISRQDGCVSKSRLGYKHCQAHHQRPHMLFCNKGLAPRLPANTDTFTITHRHAEIVANLV